ncbi:MAG: hypothetical protein ABIH90_00655 [Candidatus Aenigmatarchaeota archaeon]
MSGLKEVHMLSHVHSYELLWRIPVGLASSVLLALFWSMYAFVRLVRWLALLRSRPRAREQGVLGEEV